MVSKLRVQRIAERIREDLSEMLIHEVQDPRLVGISVTDVTVDRELAYADIYVSSLDGSERSGEIIQGLQHAAGFFRSELAQRIVLRVFPRLRFHWDPTYERAEHIERLLDSLRPGSETATTDTAGSKAAESSASQEPDTHGQ